MSICIVQLVNTAVIGRTSVNSDDPESVLRMKRHKCAAQICKGSIVQQKWYGAVWIAVVTRANCAGTTFSFDTMLVMCFWKSVVAIYYHVCDRAFIHGGHGRLRGTCDLRDSVHSCLIATIGLRVLYLLLHYWWPRLCKQQIRRSVPFSVIARVLSCMDATCDCIASENSRYGLTVSSRCRVQ